MQAKRERIFLGWQDPLPQLAVKQLFSRIDDRNPADFGSFLILVPTAEAGRLLREAVAEACAGLGGVVGLKIMMPDMLLAPSAGAPSSAQVLTAWSRVLRTHSAVTREEFFGPEFEKRKQDPAQLLNAGRMLQDCRRNLAEDGLSAAAAAEKFRAVGQLGQAKRFDCLAELEAAFLQILPDDPVAEMLRRAPEKDDTQTVIVLHCPDLRGAAAKFLDRWSGNVEYWIHAPEDMQDRFDRQGRALDVWRDAPFEADPIRQIRIAAHTEEQVDVLERFRQQLPIRAVGVLDAEVADAWRNRLLLNLKNTAMPVFFPATRALADMPWTRAFLQLLALRADNPSVADVAAVLHHSLFADRQTLKELDERQKDLVAQDLSALLHGDLSDCPSLKFALDRLGEWRRRLRDARTSHLSAGWNILREKGEKLPPGRVDLRTAEAELTELESLISAAEAAAPDDAELQDALIRHLIAAAQVRPVPEGGERLDAVGFLELGWYGDRTVLVAGFSENAMGYSGLADAFLPDQAKTLLGMHTVAKAQAADAFRFTALQHSAELRFLVLRHNMRGDMLKPPSILLQCPESELPDRIKLLFGSAQQLPRHRFANTSLPALQLHGRRPVKEKLSVTDFSAYMNCPFTFYLQRVLGVQNADDRHIELDGAQSGSLIHDVLAQCADTMQAMADEEALFAAASGHFLRLAEKYSTPRPGLLAMQFQIMTENLRYFAKVQTARAKEGWQVIRTEKNPEETILECSWADFYHRFFPDAEREAWRDSFNLKGRFDRLDRRINPADGIREFCVIDYKTGQSSTPREKHLTTSLSGLSEAEKEYRAVPHHGYWTDLQLPLYILMIRCLLPEEEVRGSRILAAYFNLPVAYASTAVEEFTELDESMLISALHCADEIARRICGPNPVFWPPRRFDKLFSPYAAFIPEEFDLQHFFPPPQEADR